MNGNPRRSLSEFGYSGILGELEELAKKRESYIHLSYCDPPIYGYTLDPKTIEKIDMLKLSNYTNYPSWNGKEELRFLLSQRIKEYAKNHIEKDDIILTYGVSEGFPLTFGALFNNNPGSIAIPDPSYIPLMIQAERFGKVWFYPCNEENEWNPDIDYLQSSLERNSDTKAIVIITPNSPTGAIYPEKILKELINLAGQYNLVLFTDEIYDALSYVDFHSPLEYSYDVPIVYLNGFSKTYRLCGYRIGYLGWYDPEEKNPEFWKYLVRLCKGRLGINLVAQDIAELALKENKEQLLNFVNSIDEKIKFIQEHLNSIETISVVPAGGGTYLFPKLDSSVDEIELVKHLLRKYGYWLNPGSAYGPDKSKNHLRFVALESIQNLKNGIEALKTSIEDLARSH